MTKKRTSLSKSSSTSSRKTSAGVGLGGLLLVIVLVVLSQVTGIDLLGLLTGETAVPSATLQPTLAAVTPPPAGTLVASADTPFYVMFSAPTGSRDASTYVNGPDTILAADLAAATRTIDIAAFEMNSPAIASALLAAHQRNVQVRIVTDNDHGLDVELYQQYKAATTESARQNIADEMETPPDDTLLDELYDAGIPIVDDGRSALMHNKFVIIDSSVVWTGSLNLTINGSYRNNNNFIRARSQRMVQDYQTEFDEMFVRREFGPSSTANTPYPQFDVNGVPVEVYFAPEDHVITQIVDEIRTTQRSIKFMAFSFTENDLGAAFLEAAGRGVQIAGVFETTGSLTEYSELTPLFCAGLDVRQDGNPFILHHKVIILDDSTVILGSFNFSGSATDANDENLVIIHDAGIASQYLAEYARRMADAHAPEGVTCN